MHVSKIAITQLRNLRSVQVEPLNGFNLLIGKNGSGKTSFLEGLYFLSLARSFRSFQTKPIITHDCEQMTISGVMGDGGVIGIEKNRSGKVRIKVNGELCKETASLVTMLPLQLINPDGYKILESGPQFRRKFLDWGVFHVKHSFFKCWQRANHVLQQRNAALRQGYSKQQVALWDKEFIETALLLDGMRQEYFSLLQPIFISLVNTLIDEEIHLSYFCGWNQGETLENELSRVFERDKYLGYTQFGPHRADLVFTVNQFPAIQVLSRGQQKLLVCALKIAQGILLHQETQKRCLYLIDDLAAELDKERLNRVIGLLRELKSQVFITAVEEHVFQDLHEDKHSKMFHVKHGCVQ